MKLRFASLAVLLLALAGALAAAPASAQTVLYNNATSASYSTGAWYFFNFAPITDSFTLSSPATVGGADAYFELDPGATVTSVDWDITSSPFGGTVYSSGTDSTPAPNTQVGTLFGFYPIFEEDIAIPSLSLSAGTYWFEISNGAATYGPIGWDESDGPSTGNQAGIGSIPSETFQILGTTVPEGGAPLLYLLLAAAACGGAIFFGSRTSLRTSELA
ncbi:MAG: hypothetical protein ACRD3N_02500 [Terracidiphilus sp.]